MLRDTVHSRSCVTFFFRHSSALSILSLMATATTRKRSLENKHLPSYGCSAIIPSCSHSSMLAKYILSRLMCAPLNYIQRIKDLLLLCSSWQNRKCAKFTLLFCRGHHGIVLKCVSHDYFSVLPACVWLELRLVEMISAQHSSNNGKNWQKLSYQKILLAW